MIKLGLYQMFTVILTLENQCMQSIKLIINKEISCDNLNRCRISVWWSTTSILDKTCGSKPVTEGDFLKDGDVLVGLS